MRSPFFILFFLTLLLSPVFCVDIEKVETGGSDEMREQVRAGVIKMLMDMFGAFSYFKIEGAVGPVGLFSGEFLAAFFMVYFLLGYTAGFGFSGGPQAFLMNGLPKILFTLMFTMLMWNTFGGMRYERFLILLIPPMLVYFILTSVLKNFALLTGTVVQLISITAATIAFLFYSPRLVDYIEGRFVYGLLDNLALSTSLFFLVYIFGIFLTKFTNQVVGPLRNDEAMTNRALVRRIKNIEDRGERRRISNILELINMMKGVG